jgi:glutathione S-transferase
MNTPILYSFRRCPYAMRARMALKLANLKCELREVELKNKPEEMLQISPKGTVPILVLDDAILDESNDIIQWVISNNPNFLMSLDDEQSHQTSKLVDLFDSEFKHHLDRYKYHQRYGSNATDHREKCDDILYLLDKKILKDGWIFSDEISLLDISILPFIRQFKIADESYFYSQNYKKVINLLKRFENSDLFESIMNKYEPWQPDQVEQTIFP